MDLEEKTPETDEREEEKETKEIGLSEIVKMNGSLEKMIETKRVIFACQRVQKVGDISELSFSKTLIFSNNQLTEIDPSIQKLRNLTSLDLSYNRLTSFNFVRPFKSLSILNLSNNRISKAEDISDLPVTTLNLSSNRIGFFSSNALPRKCKNLNLSCNQITVVEPFVGNNNLETIDLSQNLLEVLDGRHVQNLKKLEELNLSQNKLTSAKFLSVLPQLSVWFIFLIHSKA